jgi:hypothetical protein
MTNENVTHALAHELAHRLSQAAKACDLLRNAADRLEGGDPEETRSEQAARMRGAGILALTAALELASVSGWIEALGTVEGGAS